MSADVVRRAASLIRQRATAATDGGFGWHVTRLNPNPGEQGFADAERIASWHPAVALAVAKVLDAAMEHIESHDCEAHCEPNGCDQVNAAFDLARAYLGADA